MTNQNPADTAIQEIATTILGLPTLETRNADSLDFHDVAIWTIRRALEAAYEAGSRSQGNKGQ